MSTTASSGIPALPKPLSAYNLFYRYKRSRIIRAGSGDKNGSCGSNTREAIAQLITCPAGLEEYCEAVSFIRAAVPPDRIDEIRGSIIRLALDGQMFSKDRKDRVHSKSGLEMSFSEMNKMLVDSWKGADEFSKALFKELATEARRDYECRMNKHYSEKYRSLIGGKMSSSTEENRRVHNQGLVRVVTDESISSSSRTASLKSTVSARSPGLNASWDDFPFQNKELAPNSSCIRAVRHNEVIEEKQPSPASAEITSSVVGESHEARRLSLGDFSLGDDDLPEPADSSEEDFLKMFTT